MALTHKEGWLYFLGEKDFKTGNTFSYVKVGKTDYDRPVSQRKNDHQTGNPRHIVEVAESIRTNFIDTLETYMHNRFSTYRVHGEWFLLDKKKLTEVVEEANRVNALLDTVLTEAKEIDELKYLESNGKVSSSNDLIDEIYREFLVHEEETVLHQLEREITKYKIVKLASSHGGVRNISEQSIISKSKKFDKKSFEISHPDIFTKYILEKEGISASFTIVNKPTASKLDKETNNKIKVAKANFRDIKVFNRDYLERDPTLESLHLKWLESNEKEAESNLLSEIFGLKLKHACGKNDSIDNICKWKRVLKVSQSFDSKSFKKEQEELYNKFLIPQASYPRCVIIRSRPY